MTKLTLLNRDNNKMTGGGNIKQGLRPLATGFFGFRLWTEKKASYSGVRFVGETPSPAAPWTATLNVGDSGGFYGYIPPAGSLSNTNFKGLTIIELSGLAEKITLAFNPPPPVPLTLFNTLKIGPYILSIDALFEPPYIHEDGQYYEWHEQPTIVSFLEQANLDGNPVAITIE